jgi:hypothetical protein
MTVGVCDGYFFRHFILRAHFPTALHDNSTKEIMLLKILRD